MRIRDWTHIFMIVAAIGFVGCSKSGKDEKGAVSTKIPEGKNRLALEKSPYLLQHADNPVDWYPWGEEAFEKAKREDKPIFLSIGYSTCHWCHVMEHESFEDSTVAALMNDAFVNIKVDREERPDVDNIYMKVCQMMTGSGGWPLTVILTPEREAFFAATYIPKDGRYGRSGMVDLIPQLKDAWQTRREDIAQTTAQITQRLEGFSNRYPSDKTLGESELKVAFDQFKQRFDAALGGFGAAPKFPTPHNYLFLLRYWKRTGDGTALLMVEESLSKMALGGIYDHVGFGFHRYSTDVRWFAPHFEKMLYDQALLVMAYTETYLATGKPFYRRIAEEIITYVLRDMTDKEGAYYSAEDADSEKIEGKFYLWSTAEIRQLLQDKDAELFIDVYGLHDGGNFSAEVPQGNIAYLPRPLDKVAEGMGMTEQALRGRLEIIRQTLFEVREKRIHPGKDDKILTDWNGLMIAAMAKAGRAFNEPRYTESAEAAAQFFLKKMRDGKGLLHRFRTGDAGIKSNIDDYAFFVWALLELYENTFNVKYLESALGYHKYMIEHFWDDERGAFFFTSDEGEALIIRMKEIYDGAIPSGNSVAMLNMIRMGKITADPSFEDYAERIGRTFYDDVTRSPSGFTLLLAALDFGVGPSFEVVIVGNPGSADTKAMRKALNGVYIPSKVVVLKPDDRSASKIVELAAYTKSQTQIDGKATAYVCRNYACELPTNDAGKMLELLGASPK